MNKKISLVLFALVVITSAKTQDIHFTMFNFAPLNMNPANAGAENDYRFTMNYRNQWKTVTTSPFKTMSGAFDMRISKIGEGFLAGGINFYNDKAGDSQMGVAQGNLHLAYHLKLTQEQTVGLGIMTGYAQRSMTSSALTWGSQYDGMNYNSSLMSGEPAGSDFTKSFMDLGAGAVYTFNKGEKYSTGNDQKGAIVGFSVMHLNAPDYSFYGNEVEPLYRKFMFHANGLIGISNSRISFAPGVMYAWQGGSRELLMGSNVRCRLQEDSRYTGIISGASLSLGCWYRNKDAIMMTTLLQFGGYSIGFAYDFNTSDLKEASNGKGGIEFAFRFVYPNSSSYGRQGSTRFL